MAARRDRGGPPARRVGSLCLGAFALADAGILDGRRATTHSAHAAELAGGHPAVEVDAAALYVDEDPVPTSFGVAAGINLHLVRRDHGQAVATRLTTVLWSTCVSLLRRSCVADAPLDRRLGGGSMSG